MEDILKNSDDKIEVEPSELGPEFTAALTSTLAKQLASQYEKPWTEQNESDMQENISALVAAANEGGLQSIRMIVTQPSGQKIVHELDIDRISHTRSLQ